MNSIVLQRGGLYTKEYDENTNLTSLVPARGPISMYLQNSVEVRKGTTVHDLMEALIYHEADINAMFYGFSKGHKLRPFYDEMLLAPKKKRTDLSMVEIAWSADYCGADRKGRHNELYLSVQVSAVMKKKFEGEIVYLTLSQVGLNDWKHLPIEICDTLRVSDFRISEPDGTGRTQSSFITLMEAKKEMTLYDIIGGFIDSITWYGYPEQRKERVEDIERMVVGPDECADQDALEDKEYELEKALRDENYERAAVLKTEIDSLRRILPDS